MVPLSDLPRAHPCVANLVLLGSSGLTTVLLSFPGGDVMTMMNNDITLSYYLKWLYNDTGESRRCCRYYYNYYEYYYAAYGRLGGGEEAGC